MRKMETLLLLSPELSVEEREAVLTNLGEVIARENGTMLEVDQWGMRDLAYPVRKQMRGFYVRLVYGAPSQLVAELERIIRITDGIFKLSPCVWPTASMPRRRSHNGFPQKLLPVASSALLCRQGSPSDYKRPDILRDFITERGKIVARRITGLCARHQRQLTTEIKRARQMALLFYTTAHSSDVKKKDHHLSGKENRYENYSSRRCGKSRPPG